MAIIAALFLIIKKLSFIILGLFGIGFIIGFHEFGHFLFCKIFNIYTPSFSIGFGPKLIEKKIGDTVFALSAIPLGGYVEIAGNAETAQGEQKHANSTDERSFANKPYYQKMLVMSGGILFNLIFAYIAFIIIFMIGAPNSPILYPTNVSTKIMHIAQDSPAHELLQAGDIITAINNTQVLNNPSQLFEEISQKPDQEVSLSFMRNNQLQTISVKLRSQVSHNKTIGILGIVPEIIEIPGMSLRQSITTGIMTTNKLIIQNFHAIKNIFTKRETETLGGPIMLISETIKGAGKGLKIFLLLLALISISLALLNLIPLPILDGGQALFCTIESLLGRPMSESIRNNLAIGSWLMMILLAIILSIRDISRIASPFIEQIVRFFGW